EGDQMASFREMFFTPAEFANIAKVDRNVISALETDGLLKTTKRKMGNVDRKMIALEDMQQYFRALRGTAQMDPSVAAATMEITDPAAAETSSNMTHSAYAAPRPKHKTQMFYNVKGGTGKSTLTAQYV